MMHLDIHDNKINKHLRTASHCSQMKHMDQLFYFFRVLLDLLLCAFLDNSVLVGGSLGSLCFFSFLTLLLSASVMGSQLGQKVWK